MKSRVWLVVVATAFISGISIASSIAPTAQSSSHAETGSLPVPTQSMTVEQPDAKPYVRTTPPNPIRLPVAKNAQKRDFDALRARQNAHRSGSQRTATEAQPKPAFTGPRYIAPAVKAGPITGDNVADPFYLGSLPATEIGTTDGYSDDYNGNCGSNDGSPDVVYRFYSDYDQYITVDLCYSSFDTRLYISYVWDEETYVACDDDFCGVDGLRSRIESFYLGAGDEIFIIIDGFGGDYGDYELSVFRVGDIVTDPIVIETLPYSTLHTTDGYNNDYDEDCGFASESNDVVFRYLAPNDQQVTIDLCGSSYDTKVFVYQNVVTPGAPFACNEDSDSCQNLQSRIECLQLYSDSTYYIVIDGYGNQYGEFYLDMDECFVECWTGCVQEATLDQEICPNGGIDEVNGGCYNGGYFQPLQPNEIVCGSVYFTAAEQDEDWYTRYLFEGDSITWCIVANFPVYTQIVDLTPGCWSETYIASDYRLGCDTIYLGHRVESDGMYAFIVQNYYVTSEWPCDLNPQYQAQLIVSPKCEWGFCPIVSVPENEGCDIFVADDFNNGCYTNPASFSYVPDNQYVCGLSWRYAGDWDEDAYLWSVTADQTVNFSFQAEFPAAVYVYDVGFGSTCAYGTPVAFHETVPCEILDIDIYSPVSTNLAFIVLIRDVGNEYHCDQGPWEYALIFNGRSECPEFVCDPTATVEAEGCEITKSQGYNAGCNSVPPTFATIAYDETVCGTAWYGAAGFNLWRDTDWHSASIADGDSVVWCVTAEFAFDAFIVDVSPDCDFDSNFTIVYDTGYACDTIYLTTVKQPEQNLKFIIAPRFFFPWLWCELGEWNWEATLTKANQSCACDCAHNPVCDAFTDILDVSEVVSVAFRNGAAIPDPNGACPYATTDVDCNNFTDIIDVTRIVNVAFRNGNPLEEFCDPCVSADRMTIR